ncbi:fasciclin domain-containing protein [Halorubrum sp. CBA1229]|uniref:fasciclin domain-containing protein n=1 Tax=Halorubrum sp. CBA1229 TaxID=1853699 RepID=UPI000F3FCEAE|nr:fasciclin domain-containing protein [Halorubrum sp. CBA1229]QKY16345.1 fasciclin domain-containing protein [Halorubrum sp. CBA1229]
MNANRRTVLKGVGAGTVALLGGVGTGAAKPPSQGDTVVDVASGDERLEVLVAAVQEAGLVETLSGNRQLTVFAPTNEAFGDALEALGADSLDDVDDEALANILTYHVVPGRRKANSIVNADSVPTLNGAKVDVDGTDLNGDQADIVDTNIEASNGIIHVIDGVLLP